MSLPFVSPLSLLLFYKPNHPTQQYWHIRRSMDDGSIIALLLSPWTQCWWGAAKTPGPGPQRMPSHAAEKAKIPARWTEREVQTYRGQIPTRRGSDLRKRQQTCFSFLHRIWRWILLSLCLHGLFLLVWKFLLCFRAFLSMSDGHLNGFLWIKKNTWFKSLAVPLRPPVGSWEESSLLSLTESQLLLFC